MATIPFGRCTWRGIPFPFVQRTFGFQQEQAKDRFVQVEVEQVQSLGRSNPTWGYDIPARENLVKAPWTNWFTKYYDKFLAACVDSEDGELVDIIHGTQSAKLVVFSETFDGPRPDGVDLHVEFIYSPPEELTANAGSIKALNFASMKAQAGALDGKLDSALTEESIAALKRRGQQPPKPLVNVLTAFSGAIDQVTLAERQYAAVGEEMIARVNDVKRSVDRLQMQRSAQARLAASRLQEAVRESTFRSRGRPIRIVQVSTPTGRVRAAQTYGMSVSDLLELNPQLATMPMIPPRVRFAVYTGVTVPFHPNL